MIWNGFQQDWERTNHRINSLGDFVGPVACEGDQCSVTLTHTAASGSASDTAVFTSRYTAVSAPGVSFLQGGERIRFDLPAGEGKVESELQSLSVPLPAGLPPDVEVHALLAGFDLFATRDADRLATFEVDLTTPIVTDGEIRFDIEALMATDCDSLECDGMLGKLDQSLEYDLDVAWLLTLADPDALQVDELALANGYSWPDGRGAELEPEDVRQEVSVDGRPGGASAVAFTGLTMRLDRDHHMAGWASALAPTGFDADSGRTAFSLDMMFKQWSAATLDYPLSYAEAETVSTEARVAVLQLADGCASSAAATGRLDWTADGAPGDSERAVQSVVRTFDGACALRVRDEDPDWTAPAH